MIYQVKATIVKNKQIADDIYELILDIPKIASKIQPGQFMHFKINDSTDPLLRRPLSVNRLIRKKNSKGFLVVVIYKVVGKGTALLAEKCAGDTMDVLGPLGNGFVFEKLKTRCEQVLIVCGGMGVAPLIFLAEKLSKFKMQNYESKIIVFIGAAKKNEIICADVFRKLGCEVKISTDDGTYGFHGKVTELLDKYLRGTKDTGRRTIYACGPLPMLYELNKIAYKYKLEGQVSVDKMMGCGVGACLGCVIKIKNYKSRHKAWRGSPKAAKVKTDFVYKRICKDGPVFDIKELV